MLNVLFCSRFSKSGPHLLVIRSILSFNQSWCLCLLKSLSRVCMYVRMRGNRTLQSPLWLDLLVISSSYSEPAWGVWSVTSDNSIYSHVATQERSNLRDDALAQSFYVHLFHWQQTGISKHYSSHEAHIAHIFCSLAFHWKFRVSVHTRPCLLKHVDLALLKLKFDMRYVKCLITSTIFLSGKIHSKSKILSPCCSINIFLQLWKTLRDHFNFLCNQNF